jgi:hypothetical protein
VLTYGIKIIPLLIMQDHHNKNDDWRRHNSSQDPLFEWFGTPKEHKRRVLYDTGHDVPDNEVVKETLNWLDRYLGPVKR